MKQFLSKTAIIALMVASATSFALAIAGSTDFGIILDNVIKVALGAASYGSFLVARKIYKGNLATGNQ